MKIFVRTVNALSWLGGLAAMLLMAAAVLVVCQMIIWRYFLNESTVWQTEFVIYAIVAATFLGAGQVLIQKGHVGIDLLPLALKGNARVGLELLANLLSLLFLGLLAYSSWHHFHEAWSNGWTTDTVWALPLWIPLLPMPIGIGILCLQYIADSWQLLNGQTPGSDLGAHGHVTQQEGL